MSATDFSKPSRYRSLRSAATASRDAPSLEPTPGQDAVPETSNLNRSRSRYHQKSSGANQNDAATGIGASAVGPPLPSLENSVGGVQLVKRASDAFAVQSREYLASPTPPIAPERVLTPRADAERRRRLVENSTNRKDGPKIRSPPREKPWTSAAPQQILSTTVDVEQEKSASCFGGVFRRRKNITHQQPERPNRSVPKEKQFIKQGGGGVVPGTDAPKSAVNSGERRVLVECNVSAMQFPVDLDTTAADLLQSAANCFPKPIDPKTYVIVESFGKAGVQRPLRRYERIRDTMNSWDDDVQNSLIVMPAVESGADPALLYTSRALPPSQEDQTFSLYYSQKVGTWNRRYITLRPDGQIISRKKPTSSDRDAVNVCHLSDYDIYTPTVRQTSRKIRPPKKLCFAIKSQQKSSIFESTESFIHFFSTSDKNPAIDFYLAIQGWRSHYLVNNLVESTRTPPDSLPTRTTSISRHNHARASSEATISSRHHIGAFRPLIAELPAFDADAHPSVRALHPPINNPSPLIDRAQTRASIDAPQAPIASEPFAPASLLGRTYSQRQREISSQERPGTASSAQGQAGRTMSLRARNKHLDNSQGQTRARAGTLARSGQVDGQEQAFVPGGLLEQAGGGWGAAGQGRGVAGLREGPLVSLPGDSGLSGGLVGRI